MKLNLSLKQLPKQVMTLQLQAAIRLLQLSATDLNQEIQNIFETNPLIEKEEPCEEYEDDNCHSHYAHYKGSYLSENKNVNSTSEIIERTTSEEDNLKKYLLWQLHLLNISSKDMSIAETIIDYVNNDGYLIIKTFELFDEIYKNSDITIDEFIAVKHLLQNFDPVGTCVDGIQESLLVQIKNSYENNDIKSKALRMINEYFQEYTQKDFHTIEKNLKLNKNEILLIDQLIKKQKPRPGSCFLEKKNYTYIIPDVLISKKNDNWVIKSNKLISPDIRINEKYTNIKKNITINEKEYIKKNLQEAKFFIKNIKYRNDTLLMLSESIFKKQISFFENGVDYLLPMNLKEIAADLKLNESTISRLTTNKYVETPHGVLELKFFFSSHIKNQEGNNISSKSIKHKIKNIISSENKSKPYNDSQIVNMLAKENILIARRTVAKYRTSLGFNSSSKRKN